MDDRSLTLLEFPLVCQRLAGHTSFAPGRRLAEALLPSSEPVLVARGREETDQARGLLEEQPGVGVGGAHDIGPWVDRATRGGRLDPAHFLQVADTIEAATRLRATLAEDRRPLLHELAPPPPPPPPPPAAARRGPLRSAVRIAYDRLRRRLDSLVGSELGDALQEPIVTLRNGRYVVPVRADAERRGKGIVHDASGAGQTLFVGPLAGGGAGHARGG